MLRSHSRSWHLRAAPFPPVDIRPARIRVSADAALSGERCRSRRGGTSWELEGTSPRLFYAPGQTAGWLHSRPSPAKPAPAGKNREIVVFRTSVFVDSRAVPTYKRPCGIAALSLYGRPIPQSHLKKQLFFANRSDLMSVRSAAATLVAWLSARHSRAVG